MKNQFKNLKIGVAMCGSFCTFDDTINILKELISLEADITPIMSFNAANTDTRFGNAEYFKNQLVSLSGKKVIETIAEAEPIGPKKMLDILLIMPCTGNTMAKLANAVTDTPVLMAAKSHLRNNLPVVIAFATNDALGGSMKNIGSLMETNNIFFVPFHQDDYINKPKSLVAKFDLVTDTILKALNTEQYQPVIAP